MKEIDFTGLSIISDINGGDNSKLVPLVLKYSLHIRFYDLFRFSDQIDTLMMAPSLSITNLKINERIKF